MMILDSLYAAIRRYSRFGYNFAETEPICTKSGALWVDCCGQILGAISAVATVWEAGEIVFLH